MKTPKRPSKEQPLPTQDESRRTNVLMEHMLSKFNAFGEAQSILREDVNSLKPRFDTLEHKVDGLDSAVRSHSNAINANTEAVHALQADVTILKSDVAEIKGDIKGYNQRLEVVETKVAS